MGGGGEHRRGEPLSERMNGQTGQKNDKKGKDIHGREAQLSECRILLSKDPQTQPGRYGNTFFRCFMGGGKRTERRDRLLGGASGLGLKILGFVLKNEKKTRK